MENWPASYFRPMEWTSSVQPLASSEVFPSLRLEKVAKTYANRVRAVVELSLTATSGTITMLLGPSGCGKTTLLRVIAGLESPDAGRVIINEEDVTAWPPRRRGVAMLFQTPALYPGK